MVNKKKIGKARKDKFYHLAKESGFRARSAFKLIQLNRKFEFLQGSRVVIDLCAAPGGWLQVATENCPVSSLIIGVDLVPIKPIRNCVTLVNDITTDKCRQELRREMKTWKADCVLHDGAPNVGMNWAHDAFQQVQLTLQALKIATEFLRKGGWFVTKVFRSKDYNSLLWVLQQLFKNVHATKPQASRNESAEIFVVCQHFLAPDKIDPKFLDPKAVFKEVDDNPNTALDLIHPEKRTRHRDGYKEGDYTLFHSLPVSQFFASENFLDLLADASEVKFDDKSIENHPSTIAELKECLKDIKVLGKREIKMVINWRKKIKKEIEDEKKAENVDKVEEKEKKPEDDDDDDDMEKLEAQLAELQGEQKKVLKRKIKKTRRERAKLQHKMDMKIVLPDDKIDMEEDRELFNLDKIKTKNQLETVEEADLSDASDEEEEEEVPAKKGKKVTFDKEDKKYNLASEMSDDSDEDNEEEYDDSDGSISLDEAGEEDNPLLIGRQSKKSKADMWFSKDTFAGLEDDDDEDMEIENMAEAYSKKGGVIKGVNDQDDDMIIPEEKVSDIKKTKIEQNKKGSENDGDSAIGRGSGIDDESDNDDDDDDDESSEESDRKDSDSDSDYDTKEFYRQQKESLKDSNKKGKKNAEKIKDGDFEVVPVDHGQPVKLSAQGLALGAAIVSSRKRRREVIESGYHKYMFNDPNLPDWFVKEEQRHTRVHLPVTKGEIEEYKMKMKAVDANPIRKIAEAKARKKRKMARRLEKARKKADAINDTEEVTDREKWSQIKQVYKKAGLLNAKKKEVTYVVSKKGLAGKRVARPQGVKGPYKVVDGRLKKDMKGKMRAEQRKQGKGKRRR
ncbi:pre-rRNA 2'-O-ribose RNA methyltransferase FTSJ3-like [Dreissena polymorpha]|uniref:Putative rRNA methyltransferase n=1 Tax=Dreissena polymorpha TaxID=45954 RepID=A0A9D4BV64_DREPO|nr:pre-rRNA 2'-O-ribose RNA methyltransferase FTSJ3-like [Dreissena polymorpha]KAH3711035.1 hypothetical protein DPMN_070534 [Dreissena polymorpha]